MTRRQIQSHIFERHFRALMILVWWVLNLLCVSGAWAQEYEVTGTVTYTASRDDEVKYEKKRLFRFSFKNCQWNAKTWDAQSEMRYDEVGFQDATLFNLRSFPSKTNAATPTFTSVVASGSLPADDQSLINYLWLAYGSGCFFAGKEAGMLEPIWEMDDPVLNATGFKMQAFWDLRERTPKVPARIIYLNDGFSKIRRNGQPVLMPIRAPYDKGYTNAVLFGEGTVTQNGMSFPATSVFRRYYVADPLAAGEPARLLVRTEIKAEISAVKDKVSIESILPQFKGHFNIQDRRAKLLNPDVPVVIYSVTNGNWPSLSYVQELVDKKKRGKAQQDLR